MGFDLTESELKATRKLHGLDKEGNIEEDIEKIKQLNNLLKFFRTHGWIPNMSREINTNGTIEAIEHMLAEREQDKKRIKEIEEERQLVGMPVKNKRDGRIGVVLHQWESGSVAVLENINPRIINTHDNWSTLEILTDEVKQTQTKCDSIPVQKVKDKIEELKQKRKKEPQGTVRDFILVEEIKFLEELLEEK